MTVWLWRALVAVLVVVAIAAGVNALFGDGTDPADDFEVVTSDDEALSVGDAINRNPQTPFAIRGYVYDDGAFVQLCEGITHDADPPRCRGPVLLVRNLDLARLDLTEAERDGVTVRYTEEPVILGGTVDGTQLSVLELLNSRESDG